MPEEATDYQIQLYRTGKDVTSKAEKGYMVVFIPNGLPYYFSTRERGDGYVSLRVGTYEMEHSTKNKVPKYRCLRPIEWKIAGILIHESSGSGGLEGCIAPGFPSGDADWSNSHNAMESLFLALGGYEPGKRVTLQVMNNVSYVPGDRTRDNWPRLK